MTQSVIIGRDFPKVVIPLVEKARKSIDIIVYEWKFYPDQIGSVCQKFNNAIVLSARRGVRVRALTRTADSVVLLKKNGVDARQWAGGKTLHIKLIIFDEEIAVLGSHNYTMNAFTRNHEISVALDEEIYLKSLISFFEGLW